MILTSAAAQTNHLSPSIPVLKKSAELIPTSHRTANTKARTCEKAGDPWEREESDERELEASNWSAGEGASKSGRIS